MEKIAAIILFLVFPFGQLLRFDMGRGTTIHVNDLVVGFIGFIGIIRNIRIRDGLKKSLIFWILAAGVSLALNFHLVGLLYLVRWVAYAGLYFFFRDFKDKDFLRRGLQAAILVVAVIGLGQYLFMPDTTFLAASNWDDHSFRLVSTFLDPGFIGVILVLGLISIFNFQFSIFNQFSMIKFSMIYTGMLFTYSRASYLAYLVGIIAISFYKKSWKLLATAVMIFALTIFLLPKNYGESTNLNRENSVWARIHNWQQAIQIWQKSPIFGVGFGNYQYYSGASIESHAKGGSDSSMLTVLATTGAVGLIVYLGVLRGMWVVGKKNYIFKAGLLAIFIHSWFNNTLFYPWVMEWLWITLAVRD